MCSKDHITPFLVGTILVFTLNLIKAQDLSQGLAINDLDLHPMQDVGKPAYLDTIIDPSFGTTIRRITDAGPGGEIVPMYSTVQAWNADESYMILYDRTAGQHRLLNGNNYEFIRYLDDINPSDVEELFWDFNAPDTLYYLDRETDDFILYRISNRSKEILVNLSVVSSCSGSISLGNDVQMMSWDSDNICFRCDNEDNYSYRLSTGTLTTFAMAVEFAAPAVAPSGNLYYHINNVYENDGSFSRSLNETNVEHSCIGKLTSDHDAHFTIAFEEGPNGGCIGDIIAHDLSTGICFPLISEEQGYDYPQSGTHISALAHKNTEGGWIAASMIGYDQDGQELLDQELVIAKADEGNVKVCRIGHHRSDEDEFDYWGEPHAVISPRGTRVLFGSDWSGAEDGVSLDSYVVELPAYENALLPVRIIEFEVETADLDVRVLWSTASEVNVDYFVLERSIDEDNWVEVEHIAAVGNSSERQDYLVVDDNPWNADIDILYYRLRMVDIDGREEYSIVQLITPLRLLSENLHDSLFKVFPNPSQGWINVQLVNTAFFSTELEYFIYSLDGQLIRRGSFNVEEEPFLMNVLNWKPGVYVLKVIGDQSVQIVKIQLDPK